MRRIVILLLLLSVAFSAKSIGAYGDYSVIATDGYVVKVPQDLSQLAVVQNSFIISLIPRISINDAAVDFSVTPDAGLFDNPSDTYAADRTDVLSDVEVYAKVSIEWNQIVTEVRFRNIGVAAAKIDLSYTLRGEVRDISVFSPENYYNKTSNYLVLLQPGFNGQALGVIASQELVPGFLSIFTDREYPLILSLSELAPGQTFSLQIKYYPFVLRESDQASDYPPDLYSFINEPLVMTTGIANESATGTLDEKITSMMEAVNARAKTTETFSSLHDVALGGVEFDSLDSSVYFKQLCINNDVPCRLVIGTKDGDMYAWVRAYNGNWVDIDVQNNMKQTPAYDILYLEPKTEFHIMPFYDDSLKMLYDGTGWLGSMGQLGFLLYFVLIISLAVAGVFAFLFKKVILTKVLAKKGFIGKPSADVDGKYEVLSEEIDDTFMREIIRRIKEKEGIVNIDQLVENMHFSRQLVEDGIRYLSDQKFIRKIM